MRRPVFGSLHRGLLTACVAAGVCVAFSAPAVSQKPDVKPDAKPEAKPGKPGAVPPDAKKDFFATTPDGVKLVGDYYPAADIPGRNKRESPCVILLHSLTAGASRKDFGTLPLELQRRGLAVLAFDFRGYGGSTKIDDTEYFKVHPNKRPPNNRKVTTLSPRDFKSLSDWLQMGTDISEAKLFLSKKSDVGVAECNSNNLCFIGAEHGGLLAMIWTVHGLKADQYRVADGRTQLGKLVAGPRHRLDDRPEGEDVNCIVTLSTSQSLGTQNIENPMRSVLDLLGERKIGFLVLFGEQDGRSNGFWARNYDRIKPKKEKEQLDRVALKRLEKTSLVGAKLFGNNDALHTEDFLFAYLDKPTVLKERDRPWQKKSDEEHQSTLFYIDQMENFLK